MPGISARLRRRLDLLTLDKTLKRASPFARLPDDTVWSLARQLETLNAQPGDVIVRFNNQKVDDPSQFFRLVADAKAGSIASVRALRSGRALDFKLPVISNSASNARVRR